MRIDTDTTGFTSSELTGVVFDIHRASLNDGPGVRTTVFVKGCPLRCAWCHNPESQRVAPEELTRADGTTTACGAGMSVDEVMRIVLADRAFYKRGGGGLTVSGGEPLVQAEFTTALLTAAHGEGVHTCLDTSGAVPTDRLAKTLAVTDLYLFDVKHTDAAQHTRWTGMGNGLIVENLRMLASSGARIWLRCPMVPGVNDGEDHLSAVSALARELGVDSVQLMPYHDLGVGKPRPAGFEPRRFEVPTPETVARWRALVTGRP